MAKGTSLGRLLDIIPIVIPIDLDNSQAGDQFSLENCGGVDLVFITGDGAAGRDLTFTLKRHVDMADTSGTTIALTAKPYYYKRDGTTAVGVAAWTASTFTTTDGSAIVLDDAEGEDSRLIVVPIASADLGSGYSSLSVSAVVAGGSGAKLGACMAILRDLEVMRTPANLKSAI